VQEGLKQKNDYKSMIAITKDVWEKIKPYFEQEEIFIDETTTPLNKDLLNKKNDYKGMNIETDNLYMKSVFSIMNRILKVLEHNKR